LMVLRTRMFSSI